jgi:hypothetical protein
VTLEVQQHRSGVWEGGGTPQRSNHAEWCDDALFIIED